MLYHLFMWYVCAISCPKYKTYERKTELATENENIEWQSSKKRIEACSISIMPTQSTLHLLLFHLGLLMKPEKPETCV